MQFDPVERSVSLAVGELAAFRNQPSNAGAGGGQWRATVGQQWHKVSASQTSEAYPDARFEETIKGTLLYKDWAFHLQGRIDQVIPEGKWLTLREVKTVRRNLPASNEELAATYPEYFAQAAIYLRLARLLPEYRNHELRAELLFIGIQDGAAQRAAIEPGDETLLDRKLDELVAFLDDRRSCRQRLNEIEIRPAFEELRDGQSELIEQLATASLRNLNILMQAPTGFGKTGIVLEHALQQMKAGLFERCLYLTSKSTGQLETVRQLRHMIGDGIRFIQMRNRHEHRIESPKHTCTGDYRCDDELGQHWLEADIHPPELFADSTLELDRAKEIGRQTGVCPYALSKSCLPYAEIWIGDSNYLFAPASRHVFTEVQGFDPKKTLVIIDEAHNLPARNADALSVSLNATDLIFAVEEIRTAGAGRRLIASVEAIIDEIEMLSPGKPLSTEQVYRLCDLCEDAASELEDARFDYDSTAPFALELIWRIPVVAERLGADSSHWLHWSPKGGMLQASCLDASDWTAECLKPFGSTILMSATLEPIDDFMTSTGLTSEKTSLTLGHANWREEAYEVAVDCRVDTRLKERDKHYETTAHTISSMAIASPSAPVVAFFPSYQYAENVRAYLSAVDPSLRIAVQERGLDLPAQEAFIDEALISSDALFLIIGSSYAEGIDKLGGRIHSIIVVGPALPEVNPVQQAKIDAHPELTREQAFERVYIIPAMRRIHQALGRIVRAPGQSAKVLLHGKRYQQPAYSKHLNDEYYPETVIRDSNGLVAWLSE